jgi:hypothetical protein
VTPTENKLGFPPAARNSLFLSGARYLPLLIEWYTPLSNRTIIIAEPE